MHIDDIKRGLRAEIKKRENEQYATFQCNVRQMCKDVLAKLEEQESDIAELKNCVDDFNKDFELVDNQNERLLKIVRHHKYKRCLSMAKWCKAEQDAAFLRYNWDTGRYYDVDFYEKWHKRWLELSEKLRFVGYMRRGKNDEARIQDMRGRGTGDTPHPGAGMDAGGAHKGSGAPQGSGQGHGLRFTEVAEGDSRQG